MTVVKLSRARIKRKGQVTIPQEIRTEFGLEEGTIVEFTKEDDKIIIKPLPPLEPGEPVGEEEFKKILAELDERRRNWR
ncbi:MAG: AbrB/MazE/SpoVT family DNA-binding domain-containing protein [Candidatus Bathyarchaeia archaeon]